MQQAGCLPGAGKLYASEKIAIRESQIPYSRRFVDLSFNTQSILFCWIGNDKRSVVSLHARDDEWDAGSPPF
jgi:hypothetical protein